jgi:inorganic pyrophosphatase
MNVCQETIEVIIEIPCRSNVKYEIDDNGKLYVDRIISTAMVYPGNYGFIAATRAGDGDPVDVLILEDEPFVPGSHVICHVLGLLETIDEKGRDEKIIAVPVFRKPRLHSLSEVAPHVLSRIKHFFTNYKSLSEKVQVGTFKNRDFALRFIQQSRTASLSNQFGCAT